jgi:FdhD protein
MFARANILLINCVQVSTVSVLVVNGMQTSGIKQVGVWKVENDGVREAADTLAVEEPLEIRLGLTREGRRENRRLSITMRTPGNDAELALGFLFAEGVIHGREQVASVQPCGRPAEGADYVNVLRVDLTPGTEIDLPRLERHFTTTSSCGVCGKTSLEALEIIADPLPQEDFRVEANVIHRLPATLREAQAVFESTGGLHAAALFDAGGNLRCLREDVGRHNALDKLIGAQWQAGCLPLHDSILLLSGRASFELLQKALRAEIPVVAAVGAPSSLAVELAERFHITLLGFVRNQRFNIYSVPERIAYSEQSLSSLASPTAIS